jgi:hypothetical protein
MALVIHDDAATARRVVSTALARLAGAVTAQDKRLYYCPTSASRKTKIWLGEEQILQQLVFAASDRAERADESRRTLDSHQMLIRFVKHLVWISTRRNLFYVTLAVARLLYGFSTAETAELYGSLVDDSRDTQDDAYYRARKRVVIDEIRDRFPTALRIATRSRGEMAIVATPPDARARFLVERCLAAFAPWGLSCAAHRDDDLRLMHVILHPPCFRARVTALGWPDPLPRLQVPRFG